MKRIEPFFIWIGLLLPFGCSNILEFESISPCGIYDSQSSLRFWNSVDGLVRFDSDRSEFFIVAVFPGEEELTVLRTCNIPTEFLSDRQPIRFFGNEFEAEYEELVEEEESVALIVPFEITYIERVRR